MLPASWTFGTIEKGFRSLNSKTLGSVDQKCWLSNFENDSLAGMAEAADIFLRTLNLTASNFEALWHTDPKVLAFKDLKPFSIVSKVQEAGSSLGVSFVVKVTSFS